MGYDMYLEQRDTSLDEENQAAKAAFERAVQERNAFPRDTPEHDAKQQEVEAAYARMSATDINYFRLNIWGMSEMREHMEQLDMLATHYPGHPAWPDPADYGLTREQVWDDEDGADSPDPRLRKFHAATEEVRSWSPPDEPGLPVHKFGSNDGWLVTPLDIAGALAKYRTADRLLVEKIRDAWNEGQETSYFDEWIAFLERAEKRNGFRVY